MRDLRRFTFVLSLLIAGSFGAAQAQAAAGDLDRSFARNGKVLRNLGPGEDVADVVVRRDRKILVLGEIVRNNDSAVTVTRFRRNGRIDRRFGKRGRTVLRVAGEETAAGIALQPNGGIVAAFTSDPGDGPDAFGVARLLRTGKPDASFDRDGIQTQAFGVGLQSPVARDLAIHRGDITVAGSVLSNGAAGRDFALMRFDTTGELDDSFSGDGMQVTDFEEGSDFANAVSIDWQGRVVAAGAADAPGCCLDPLAIARYNPDGELDPSFSDDGKLISTIAESATDVVVRDRIAVSGSVGGDFLVARFTADGAPDSSFAGNGVRTIDFADGSDEAHGLAASGGRLVVTGLARTHRRGRDFATARIRPNGQLDRRFSRDGRKAVDFADDDDIAYGVAIDRRNAVVLAGTAKRGRKADTGVARLLGTGRRR